jgi:anti-anti-sigma factor
LSTLESQGLEPFFSVIEARLPQVIEHIAEAARPWFSEVSIETIRRGFSAHLEPWLDSLRDEGSDAIEQQVGATCERIRGQGLPGALVLTLIEETRVRLLDAALDALDAGVPGAAEGAQRVMRVAERALITFDRSYREHAEQAERQMRLFKALADKAPDSIMYADERYIIQYANAAYNRMAGRDVHGTPLYDLLTRETLAEIGRGSAEDGMWEGIVEVLRADGSRVRGHLVAFRVYRDDGKDFARCGIFRDLSEEERSIEEERRLREQVIAAQQEALRELSAPLMPLGEGTLAMPLVGEIDGARAPRILEDLLRGISERGAQHVIVDITGVKVVDAEVAQGLVQAAQAARLLGAEVILTGIRAAVARTLLELGADLGGVVTKSTLRAGVAHVLARRGEARS